MGQYKLQKDADLNIIGVIVNDGTHPTLPQGACIPVAVGNKDYDEYVLWDAEEGNTPDAADGIDYMARMRGERDSRMNAIQWRIQRNQRQVANSETPTDDGTAMGLVYAYMADLADMPEDNSGIDTLTEYNALTWPTEPE